jgi:polyphosphate kinase
MNDPLTLFLNLVLNRFCSCDPELGRDVSDFFKYLTGFHRQKGYHKLLVAPHSMHRQLIRLCDTEIENARKGRPAGITIKCNALDDQVNGERLMLLIALRFESF